MKYYKLLFLHIFLEEQKYRINILVELCSFQCPFKKVLIKIKLEMEKGVHREGSK